MKIRQNNRKERRRRENPSKQWALSLPPFQFSFVCLKDCVSGGLLRTATSLWKDLSFLLPMKQIKEVFRKSNISGSLSTLLKINHVFEGPRTASHWSQNADQIKPVCYCSQTEVLTTSHFFFCNEGKDWYCWAQRNKMISLKNFHPLARSCKRQTDLQPFSIEHLPSQYSPRTVSSSKRACEACPGDGANPIAQAHTLQGLQMLFYRETEGLQIFWLTTEWWRLWACGHIMWALCSSPLLTHILIPLREEE